jgi:hypothetical protein
VGYASSPRARRNALRRRVSPALQAPFDVNGAAAVVNDALTWRQVAPPLVQALARSALPEPDTMTRVALPPGGQRTSRARTPESSL